MQPDLSPEDYAARAALLRDTIKADRFPLSPRIASLRAILDKLDPPEPLPLRHPPLKPYAPSMFMARSGRGGALKSTRVRWCRSAQPTDRRPGFEGLRT